MSRRHGNSGVRKLAVLGISRDRVEWYDGNSKGVQYAGADVEEDTPIRLARAAARLLKENRIRRRPCVLSLGSGMLEQRTVSLARLSPGDPRRALRRKAANFLESSLQDARYVAIPLKRAVDDKGESEAAEWLLTAFELRYARALQLELRRLGFRIQYVVSERLAALQSAALHAAEEEEAVICVGAGVESVTISLVQGGGLVQQAVLHGAYSANANMAGALLQELRGFGAFWRLHSRGGSLGRVVLVGFDREESAQLAPAIHASLPGTEVHTFRRG